MSRRHLFLITIGEYQHHPSVRGAVADAEHLAEVLREQYGFSSAATPELRNGAATNVTIREAFRSLRLLPPEDDLIIYYNGHGQTDQDDVGSWLAWDAGDDLESGANLIQNLRIRTYLREVKCRHVLLLANCCFSGDLLDEQRDVIARPHDYLSTARQFDSREVLTAGASETVPAAGMGRESPFGWHLCRALETAEGEWLDAMDLFGHIKRGVEGQSPQLGKLKSCGHKGGALILERMRKVSVTIPPPGRAIPPPPVVEPLWHVSVEGRPSPGISLLSLRKEIKAGRVTHATLVWSANLGVWTPAGSVAALVDAFPVIEVVSVPPPPPPKSSEPVLGEGVLPPKASPPKSSEPAPGEERTIELPGGVELVLCWCPATTSEAWKAISGGEDFFWMGSPEGEWACGRDFEENLHKVRLMQGFWIGKTPVTQRQWQAVAGENPSGFRKSGMDAPVEQVSWEDVQGWLAKANRAVGRIGVRLPTEAEWEYACRAGTRSALNSGQDLMSKDGYCPTLNQVGWYDKNSDGQPHPVGELAANAWGLYDMHGNVLEWCQDWHKAYPSGLSINPAGPSSGSSRVLRGGSWYSSARYCRSARRRDFDPEYRRNVIGFRVVVR